MCKSRPCAEVERQTNRDDLSALSLQLLGSILGGIAGDGTHSPVVLELGVVEEDIGDRAALGASGSKNGDDLFAGHGVDEGNSMR